jgi:hypothetical protein
MPNIKVKNLLIYFYSAGGEVGEGEARVELPGLLLVLEKFRGPFCFKARNPAAPRAQPSPANLGAQPRAQFNQR